MPLPRLHLFELDDQPWFPQTIRDFATDYLRFVEAKFALHKPVVPLVRDALEQSGAARVVDLCSGGGGPVLALYEALAADGIRVHFTLTDMYPNLDAFRDISALHPAAIAYIATSVDAAKVPPELPGLRTMFNAFHHFAPVSARSILSSAVEDRQPIAIFEVPERALSTILPLLLCPLFVAVATPFIRPFSWRRMLWTYLIPVVPLLSLWDGVISQFRAYTVAEMLELTRGLDDYNWKAGQVDIGSVPGRITYLLGIAKVSPSARV